MQGIRKHLLAVSLLAGFVFALGGCDGGGDDPTSPEISVTGLWTLTYDWQCDGITLTAIWLINADGTFVTVEDNPEHGTWTLQNTAITLTYQGGAVYSGTVDATGTTMQGTMLDANNVSGCWTAVRAPN